MISPVTRIGSATKISTVLKSNYPLEWWQEFPKDQAFEWEVLPQAVSPESGKVILSKRNELGVLSNFAPTPFLFKGKRYASMEGFWQSLKYPELQQDERSAQGVVWPYERSQVMSMVGHEAKSAGDMASHNMKQLGIDWVSFEGQKISYYEQAKGEFYQLIYQAMIAKLEQNPEVKRILIRTGDLELLPDHEQDVNSPPAWRYHQIWMALRFNLVKK